MNSTQLFLTIAGRITASSCNRSAMIAARDALRNVFVDEAHLHTMLPNGQLSAPIPGNAPTDGGNHEVDLVTHAAPDELAAHHANERAYGAGGD